MNVMEATDVSMVVKTCLEVTGAAVLMAICSTISGINVLMRMNAPTQLLVDPQPATTPSGASNVPALQASILMNLPPLVTM